LLLCDIVSLVLISAPRYVYLFAHTHIIHILFLQEMREKDEQLKGFQIELEQLISAMRTQEREEGDKLGSTSTSNNINRSGINNNITSIGAIPYQ
jgi:hypothetical protein